MAEEANTATAGRVAVTISAAAEKELPWPARQQVMLQVFDVLAQDAASFEVVFDPEEDPELGTLLLQPSSGVTWHPFNSPVPSWLRTGCNAALRPLAWLGIIRLSQPVRARGSASPERVRKLRAGLEGCRIWHVHLFDRHGMPLWHAWDCGATWYAYLSPPVVHALNDALQSVYQVQPVLQVSDEAVLQSASR